MIKKSHLVSCTLIIATLAVYSLSDGGSDKEIIFCEIEQSDELIESSCDLISFNFTFYALFRPKRSVNFKNLAELKESLSNYSTCDVRYMKYNFWNENLEYLKDERENYWYHEGKVLRGKGKVLNDTYKPSVHIIPDGKKKYRKRIIFECKLPRSDVHLSLKPLPSKTFQGHPVKTSPVTVSGLHIKLYFVPLSGININVRNNVADTLTTTTRYTLTTSRRTTASTHRRKFNFVYPTDNKQAADADSEPTHAPTTTTTRRVMTASGDSQVVRPLGTKAVQRFFIFYDSKCRNCFLSPSVLERDTDELINPTESKTVKCHVKANSCVYQGKCYADKEKNESKDYTCNTDLISSLVLMPCAKNNGNCDPHQTCEYDEYLNKVNCINNFM